MPSDGCFLTRLASILDVTLLDAFSVLIQFHDLDGGPAGARDLDSHVQGFFANRHMIPHLKPIVDGHVHPQAHADQGPSIEKCLTGFLDVDPGGQLIFASNIGAALSHDESADIMRVAGTQSYQAVASIQQGKPIVKQEHGVALQRGRGDDLHAR